LRKLLGGMSQVEQGREWRKDGMTANAADARGRVGEVDEGDQRRSMDTAAVLTDGGGRVGENELRAGGGRRRLSAQATRFVRRFGFTLEQELRHGSQPWLKSILVVGRRGLGQNSPHFLYIGRSRRKIVAES